VGGLEAQADSERTLETKSFKKVSSEFITSTLWASGNHRPEKYVLRVDNIPTRGTSNRINHISYLRKVALNTVFKHIV